MSEHPTLRRLRDETLTAAAMLATIMLGAACWHAVAALLH
jgi:hypothetical protein